MGNQASPRAELYTTLAGALSEPPAWLALAGRDWPLFDAAVGVARAGSLAARRAVETLAAIQPESLASRQRRYRELVAGPGRPRLWLHESLYLDGRLLGPSTFAVRKVYRAAGLEVEGAELPDHASLELAFLGWLAKQEAARPDEATGWQEVARRFIQRHAGRWLPDLGRALAVDGDPVYAPIGQLLADWLTEATRPPHQAAAKFRLPVVPHAETCALCGFCVQVCPTRALVMRETDIETSLVLTPMTCVGCGQCERVCDFSALRLEEGSAAGNAPTVLRLSPRAVCPGCQQPTVSRAELEAVAARIGAWPHWLDYCLECRGLIC